jgi:CBS domain-containing protein
VQRQGKLVASLSASDLRGVTSDEVDALLLLPVLEFLQRRRATTPFTCNPSTTLHDVSLNTYIAALFFEFSFVNLRSLVPDSALVQVMKSLVENKAHRLWIVDNEQKLLGVITLTDLLCKVQ